MFKSCNWAHLRSDRRPTIFLSSGLGNKVISTPPLKHSQNKISVRFTFTLVSVKCGIYTYFWCQNNFCLLTQTSLVTQNTVPQYISIVRKTYRKNENHHGGSECNIQWHGYFKYSCPSPQLTLFDGLVTVLFEGFYSIM